MTLAKKKRGCGSVWHLWCGDWCRQQRQGSGEGRREESNISIQNFQEGSATSTEGRRGFLLDFHLQGLMDHLLLLLPSLEDPDGPPLSWHPLSPQSEASTRSQVWFSGRRSGSQIKQHVLRSVRPLSNGQKFPSSQNASLKLWKALVTASRQTWGSRLSGCQKMSHFVDLAGMVRSNLADVRR